MLPRSCSRTLLALSSLALMHLTHVSALTRHIVIAGGAHQSAYVCITLARVGGRNQVPRPSECARPCSNQPRANRSAPPIVTPGTCRRNPSCYRSSPHCTESILCEHRQASRLRLVPKASRSIAMAMCQGMRPRPGMAIGQPLRCAPQLQALAWRSPRTMRVRRAEARADGDAHMLQLAADAQVVQLQHDNAAPQGAAAGAPLARTRLPAWLPRACRLAAVVAAASALACCLPSVAHAAAAATSGEGGLIQSESHGLPACQ